MSGGVHKSNKNSIFLISKMTLGGRDTVQLFRVRLCPRMSVYSFLNTYYVTRNKDNITTRETKKLENVKQ